MSENPILVLAGDGIGAEVCAQSLRVLEKVDPTLRFESALVGGAAYDKEGTPLSEETLEKAKRAQAVLFGAVGGEQWSHVKRELRPEMALITLRKALDLFANLRPAQAFPALASASSLKEEVISGLDILIVRELTSGVYFGTPRGRKLKPDKTRFCIDTQYYDEHEITRIADIAFDFARKRRGVLCSVDKANVMETGAFWREIVTQRHLEQFSDVELSHMYADNCAMQLVRRPKQFDVILTDNLFGDLLSDCAAMSTGSLGMLPSAALGAQVTDADGKTSRKAMYEPIHGSAPDIAGRNWANPCAMILSAAMMLRYSFDRDAEADTIERAVAQALADGLRTRDIAEHGDPETLKILSCSAMGSAIIERLEL